MTDNPENVMRTTSKKTQSWFVHIPSGRVTVTQETETVNGAATTTPTTPENLRFYPVSGQLTFVVEDGVKREQFTVTLSNVGINVGMVPEQVSGTVTYYPESHCYQRQRGAVEVALPFILPERGQITAVEIFGESHVLEVPLMLEAGDVLTPGENSILLNNHPILSYDLFRDGQGKE